MIINNYFGIFREKNFMIITSYYKKRRYSMRKQCSHLIVRTRLRQIIAVNRGPFLRVESGIGFIGSGFNNLSPTYETAPKATSRRRANQRR